MPAKQGRLVSSGEPGNTQPEPNLNGYFPRLLG